MHITNHAIKRMKQRGFSRDLIEVILEMGTPIKKPGDKATKYVLGKKERNKVMQQLKYLIQCLDKGTLSVIMDEGNDTVITVIVSTN